MSEQRCESCGMPVSHGPFCEHCTTEDGALQPFEERFARMVEFAMSRDSNLDRPTAEKQVRRHMGTMPAWSDHPELTG